MHSSVKKFSYQDVDLNDDPDIEFPEHRFIDFYRMPNLTCLRLGYNFSMKKAEVVAGAVFASLSKLQDLCLSPFQLTPRIVESLSRLQDLRVIDCFDIHANWSGDERDIENFKPRLLPGAFPRLEHLSFYSSFRNASTFVETRFGPGRLTDLSIKSLETETPFTFRRLIASITDSCKDLQCLSLLSRLNWTTRRTTQPPPEECIKFDDLEPLLQYSKLTNLSIRHQNPLNIHQIDLENIAAAFPSIVSLELNPTPTFYYHSTLSLRALLPLSLHCPELETLGLFVDTSLTTPIQDHDVYKSLNNLEVLNMGTSIIEPKSCVEVSLFLSDIFPLKCAIVCGTEDFVSEYTHTQKQRDEEWAEVNTILPFFAQMREERIPLAVEDGDKLGTAVEEGW
jgi:hypothetical protein